MLQAPFGPDPHSPQMRQASCATLNRITLSVKMLFCSPRRRTHLRLPSRSINRRRKPYPAVPPCLRPNSVHLHCPANTLAESSRLYSAAMVRFSVLTSAAIVVELFGTIVQGNLRSTAPIFVVGAFVHILDVTPAAHIIDKDRRKAGRTTLDIRNELS
jgi:hypothetical protein